VSFTIIYWIKIYEQNGTINCLIINTLGLMYRTLSLLQIFEIVLCLTSKQICIFLNNQLMCSYSYYTWAILALTLALWKLKRCANFERGLKYMRPVPEQYLVVVFQIYDQHTRAIQKNRTHKFLNYFYKNEAR